jgi:hypothetical protein
MRAGLYTLVVAGTGLLGGCAQVLGIEDLPPLADATSPGGDARPGDAGIPDAAAGAPDASAPGAPDAGGQPIDLARGLVGHWPLDAIEPGGGGDVTPDASGNGFDGAVDGPVLVPGRTGMALRFDGVDDLVRIGNPPALDIAGRITIAAWCRPGRVDGVVQNIVAHGSAPDPRRELFLRIGHEDEYEGGSWDGTDHKGVFAVPGEDIDAGWVHLAAAHDGAAWRLYRNGVEVARSVDATGAVTVDEDWAIGARVSGRDRFFQGDIDDVRVYDRALSAAEVAALAAP